MKCEPKFQSVFFSCFLGKMIKTWDHYGNPAYTLGYALYLKIPLFLPFPAESSQLLGFTCSAGIENKRKLYDGTSIHVVMNQGGLPVLKQWFLR